MTKVNQIANLTLIVVCLALGLFGVITILSRQAAPDQAKTFNDNKQMVLYQNMRRIWADHVIWTREYINGTVDGTADTEAVATRLMKNQDDIGNAIVPYYGAEAGAKLTALLKSHITIAVDLVAAAKADDTANFKSANVRWEANAEDIATFLSTANTNWPKSTLVDAMNMHLQTTADEVVTRLNKQYDKNVASFDTIFDHIQTMADMLSAGIIKQFPERF